MKILLLRHGQYKSKPSEKLTALGRKQARLAGKRLKGFKIDEILASTMPRAQETALIVKKQMGFRKKIKSDDLFREGVPGYPKKDRKKAGFKDPKILARDQRILNRAFKKLIKNIRADKTVLLVCHGNVIRYLVCKALGIDPLVWVKLDILQCGISEIKYSKTYNRIVVGRHNDVGHIRLKDQTFM